MKRLLLIASLVSLVAGCGPKVPALKASHPGSYAAVVGIAPECAKPAPAARMACETAARMLEQDPQTATKLFIAEWERAGFGRPARAPNAPFFVTDANRDPKSGRLLVDAGAVGASDDAQIAAFERIDVRALARVYARAGDRYSSAMKPKIAAISARDIGSLADFTSAHVFASGGGAATTLAVATANVPTPQSSAAAPVAVGGGRGLRPPTGHGPIPFQTLSSQWEVVEAGQHVTVTFADGSTTKGRLAACNQTALLIDLGNGQQEVVATAKVKSLEKE